MMKNSRAFRIPVVFVLMFLTLFGSYSSSPVNAYSDVSTITDQAFFGVWNGTAWTTVGKLDYSIAGLATVQNDVKAGNYTQAKTDLLSYFRNRNTLTMPAWPAPDPITQLAADLGSDDFLFTGEYPVGIASFITSYSTVSTDVTYTVNEALGRSGQVCFMLMARDHSNNNANINSSESAGNAPQLVLNLVGGGQQVVSASKDTTIRAGSYGDTNYGSDTSLLVKEDGATSTLTRRSYVAFDMSGLNLSSVSSASLNLYGFGYNSPFDVVVMVAGNTGFDESIITWNNTIGCTYSWTGVSGGTDWNKPPYATTEFANIVSRFYFMYDYMTVYTDTGDESYAGNIIRIWLDFITDKGNATPIYTRPIDTGMRADNMVRGYNVLKNSTSLDAGANTAILKYFWQMANGLKDPANFTTSNNHGVFETQGLYDIALYFPEFTDAKGTEGWLALAKYRLSYLATNLMNSDGSYKEATASYPVGVAGNFLDIKNIGFMNNDTFEASFDDKLQDLSKYLMDLSRPDGYVASFGDADPESESSSTIYSIAQKYPARSDLLYFGSHGAEGIVPGYTSSMYLVGKSAFMKSGYGVNDMFMSLDLNEGTHRHPDLNSITAYAYGKSLLVDPGVYSYDSDTISNWLMKTTEAHNTVETDDTAQPKNSKVKAIREWATNNVFDFWEGLSDAYSISGTNMLPHTRDVLFLRGSYWIVTDFMGSNSGTHTYNQTWHLLPNSNIAVDGTSKRAKTAFSTGANIQIVPSDSTSLISSILDGYYSPYGGVYSDAQYVSYVKTGSGDINFDTVLFPTQATDTTRDVRVTRLTTTPSVPSATATALNIEMDYGHSGNLGYYYLSNEPTPPARSFGTYNYNGKLAYIETTSGGSYVKAGVKNGTLLKNGSTNIISSPATIEDLGTVWNGTTLEISGSKLIPDTGTSTAVAIYAPSATAVKLNGETVTFTKSGNYIYAAKVVNGYSPIEDAYVRGGTYANSNFSVEPDLVVKKDSSNYIRRSYLKFDVSSFSGTVNSAKLRLNIRSVDTDASRTVKIYGTSDESWSENTITYNTAPAGSTYITSVNIANTDGGKWIELDVSSYVNGDSDKIVSFYLVNEGTSSSKSTVGFNSKENPTNKPILVISG